MSRTFRRKDLKEDTLWVGTEWVYVDTPNWGYTGIYRISMQDKELVKALAHYHSDAYKPFKDPGPSWFRNIFTERPQRRINKRELQKFMLDPDYEPICFDKKPLGYWT